jgi:DNA-directed RNA polymerase subunit alpha
VVSAGPEPEDVMLIDDLDLGVRSLNCLKREGIETVGDLIAKSEQELMCIPNFGRKSLDEVRERLEKNNLKLRGE